MDIHDSHQMSTYMGVLHCEGCLATTEDKLSRECIWFYAQPDDPIFHHPELN